jgi:hypothetical protein
MRAITGGVLAFLACAAVAGCAAIAGVDGDYFEVTDGGSPGDATNRDDSSSGDASPDARADSGRDGGSTGIQCGSSVCKVEDNKVCCVSSGPECKAPNDCSGNVTVECDAPADCVARGAGSVCCATSTNDGGTGAVKCVNSSSDCNDNTGNRRLCDPDVSTCQCTRTFTRFNMTFHYCD